MINSFDIWTIMAGIAFFLLAANFMEDAMHRLAGRKFKLFLKDQTNNRIKAIGGGALVTSLLQSSSIVNLMVLSMVGAGVLKMNNALALMLGSNLGTTLNSWILATLGFSFNINSIVLPVAGISGICMAFISNQRQGYHWLKFIFGLAFLFIALDFIKNGMNEFVTQTDLAFFNQYPLIVFLLIGIVLTGIVQSSSVTMAITLSALYSNAVTLNVAMAVILGSEIGTTFKLFFPALKGTAIKKRVAFGNLLFNVCTSAVLFLLIHPVNYFITEVLMIKDLLIALVLFQSMVNISSILLFLPFLGPLGNFLEKRFTTQEDGGLYINKVTIVDPGLAMEALELETKSLIEKVIGYSLESFELNPEALEYYNPDKRFHDKPIQQKYDHIKQVYGEIHNFYLKLGGTAMNKMEAERLDQLIAAIRNLMYAAKNIRDAQHDISQMRNSSNDIKYNFYERSREKQLNFYNQVLVLLRKDNPGRQSGELTTVYQSVIEGYNETLQMLYKESLASKVNEIEISTLINLNRELYTSYKSIFFGMKDYLLTPKEAEYFDTLPGFIR